jgi:hypothetical protein
LELLQYWPGMSADIGFETSDTGCGMSADIGFETSDTSRSMSPDTGGGMSAIYDLRPSI